MSDRNPFGGGNKHSLYVPMSELEQEALARIVEMGDLEIRILDWGIVRNPNVILGDLRMSLPFRMVFDRPAAPVPVYFFDLELWTSTGLLLVKTTLPTLYGGKPIQVAAGVVLDLMWDIMFTAIHPKLVKALVPGARGFTSRLQDRDTKEITFEGNLDLDSHKRRQLRALRQGEAVAKADTQARVAAAKRKKAKDESPED